MHNYLTFTTYNGDDYPEGLAGEESPLLARIIDLVGAYDVMTTGRPYQVAMSKQEALQEIKSCAELSLNPLWQRNVVSITLILIIWFIWYSIMGTTPNTNRFFIAIILVVLIWNSFIGMNDATRKISTLPEGKIEIENDDGQFELNVKMGSSSTSFTQVKPKVIQQTVVYYVTEFLSSATRKFKNINSPMEIALFNKQGELVRIEKIPAKTEIEINVGKEIKHVIMVYEGFCAQKNISVDKNSKII